MGGSAWARVTYDIVPGLRKLDERGGVAVRWCASVRVRRSKIEEKGDYSDWEAGRKDRRQLAAGKGGPRAQHHGPAASGLMAGRCAVVKGEDQADEFATHLFLEVTGERHGPLSRHGSK